MDTAMEIIGGADGPTAIFVAWPADSWMYLLGAVVLIAAILFIRRKRKK